MTLSKKSSDPAAAIVTGRLPHPIKTLGRRGVVVRFVTSQRLGSVLQLRQSVSRSIGIARRAKNERNLRRGPEIGHGTDHGTGHGMGHGIGH